MHHFDYMRQLPKARSPKHANAINLTKSKSFSIFNPKLLSLNNTQFQLDIEKDNLIRLKNELIFKQEQSHLFSRHKSLIQARVSDNAQIIQTILSLNSNRPTLQLNPSQPLSECNIINEEEVTHFPPVLPSKQQLNFINSLDQHNISLENQIKVKDFELMFLKKTEKVSRFTQLHLNYNSTNNLLVEQRKAYDLLKLQYDELKYRLDKTIEQCSNYKEAITRYRLQSIQYNLRQNKLVKSNSRLSNQFPSSNTPTHSYNQSPKLPKAVSRTINEENNVREKKQMAELRFSISRLHSKIEEINQEAFKADNKKAHILNEINRVESNMEDVRGTIERIEEGSKQYCNKDSMNDLEEEMVILINDIDISNQILVELNETIAQKNKEAVLCERNSVKIESDLNKEKRANEILREVIAANKQRIEEMKESREENTALINQLEKELRELKEHNQ